MDFESIDKLTDKELLDLYENTIEGTGMDELAEQTIYLTGNILKLTCTNGRSGNIYIRTMKESGNRTCMNVAGLIDTGPVSGYYFAVAAYRICGGSKAYTSTIAGIYLLYFASCR